MSASVSSEDTSNDVEIIKSPHVDYCFIQAARPDAQLRHLKRWKFNLLHLQHNF